MYALRSYRQKYRSGFSLLELLMVVSLLGVMVGMTSTIVILLRPRLNINLAQQLVISSLNRARQHAISKGNNVFVEFYFGGSPTNGGTRWKYRIVDDDGFKSSARLADRAVFDDERTDVFDLGQANNGIADNPFEVIFESPLPGGIRFLSPNASGTQAYRVTFLPSGEVLDETRIRVALCNIYYPGMYGDLPSTYPANIRQHRRDIFVYGSGAILASRPNSN